MWGLSQNLNLHVKCNTGNTYNQFTLQQTLFEIVSKTPKYLKFIGTVICGLCQNVNPNPNWDFTPKRYFPPPPMFVAQCNFWLFHVII